MVQYGDKAGLTVSRRLPIYKDLVLLQLVALVFFTDQFTKWLVREFLDFRESFPEEGFFRFTHTFNTGSAFGLFRDQNFPLILVSVVGITILVLIYRGQRRPSNLLRLSLGLQFGGAAGNLLDRLRLGHVTDFVDVGPWPIFNVADASIVTGLALLAWMMLVSGTLKEKHTETKAAPASVGAVKKMPVVPENAHLGIPTGSSTSVLPILSVKGDGDEQSNAGLDSPSDEGAAGASPTPGEKSPPRPGGPPVDE